MWAAQVQDNLRNLSSIQMSPLLAALVLPIAPMVTLMCTLCCVQAGSLVPWSNRVLSSGCKAAKTGLK